MTPKAPRSRPDTDTKYFLASLYFPAGPSHSGKNNPFFVEAAKGHGKWDPQMFVSKWHLRCHAVGKGKPVGKEGKFSTYEVLLKKIEIRDIQVCEHISTRINVLVG